jgi:ubiquinol-cytochrome c reductase iron-sulfur subunit
MVGAPDACACAEFGWPGTVSPAGAAVARALAATEATLQPEEDDSRRRFLTGAAAAIGGLGLALSAVPFIESWLPSERARALGVPTQVDLAPLEPGQMIVVSWRRHPIYIVHRTPAMVARLPSVDSELKDPHSDSSTQPKYTHNEMRSRNASYLVVIGTCTHLGCLPKARFEPGAPDLGARWPGGFLCPCHGSRFDLAGRVFKGSPASVNLVIPPYAYAHPTNVVVGVDEVSKPSPPA